MQIKVGQKSILYEIIIAINFFTLRCIAVGLHSLGSAIKNMGLFSKIPIDFKIETMDF